MGFDLHALKTSLLSSSGSAQEEQVTVNQRHLIDKILARYSTDFTVFRELLQNSNDAGASKVEIILKQQQKQQLLLLLRPLASNTKTMVVPFFLKTGIVFERLQKGTQTNKRLASLALVFIPSFQSAKSRLLAVEESVWPFSGRATNFLREGETFLANLKMNGQHSFFH